jgi:hypothetical protein
MGRERALTRRVPGQFVELGGCGVGNGRSLLAERHSRARARDLGNDTAWLRRPWFRRLSRLAQRRLDRGFVVSRESPPKRRMSSKRRFLHDHKPGPLQVAHHSPVGDSRLSFAGLGLAGYGFAEGRRRRGLIDTVDNIYRKSTFVGPPMLASPSAKALVPFVSVQNMMRLVRHVGVEAMLVELTEAIKADFARWERFEKTRRLAAHSADGVIELMPISDGELYRLQADRQPRSRNRLALCGCAIAFGRRSARQAPRQGGRRGARSASRATVGGRSPMRATLRTMRHGQRHANSHKCGGGRGRSRAHHPFASLRITSL